MAHRVIHPIKHAGKIHKPDQIVSWPADVTGDLVKLGALVPADSTPAAEREQSAETNTQADSERKPDQGVPTTTEQAEKPAKPEKPARPAKSVKK